MKLRPSLRFPLLLPALLVAACVDDPSLDDTSDKDRKDAGVEQRDDDAGTTGPGGDEDGGMPVDDGGVPPHDGGGPEPEPEPEPAYPNESCSSPAAVTPGQIVNATTFQARDDHQGSCDSSGGGADLVYTVTLDEPSGLTVFAQGYDMVLYVTQGGCEGEHEIEGGCSDNIDDTESLALELLPAGTYHIVVDTYVLFGDEVGGDFTLDVDVHPGGFCTGDAFDPDDETPVGAAFAGNEDIDTRDLGDPSTPDLDPVELVLCEADVDYFLFGHMGGDLAVDVEAPATTGALTAEVFEASLVFDELGLSDIVEGEKVADAPVEPATGYPRGYYLLKVTGSGQSALGDDYHFALAHECHPDFADDPASELDDNDVTRTGLTLFERPTAPIARSLCGDDVDSLELEVRYPGDVRLTFAGGDGMDYDVQQIVAVDGVDTLQAYPGAVTPRAQDGELVLEMPGVPADTRLYVTVFLPGGLVDSEDADPVPYAIDVTFGDPPANETCDNPPPLVVAPDAPFTQGTTFNGLDDSRSPCGGDAEALELGVPGAADVFYTFSLNEPLDTDILFNGALDPEHPERDFEGSIYLYIYPGFCPLDLSELSLFTQTIDEEPVPVCASGTDFRLRIPALPPDNYLLVVDGVYDPPVFSSERRTSGPFEIAVRSYPGGFPPPLVCSEARPEVLPSPGASVSFDVDTTVGSNELVAGDYGCFSFGAAGPERAIVLEPTQDLTVDIVTSDTFDTMLALREANCTAGIDLVCNDDDPTDFVSSSRLDDVSLSAGTTYYLFVDGYFEYSEGTTTVTITAQ